jgi:hypothetical protein
MNRLPQSVFVLACLLSFVQIAPAQTTTVTASNPTISGYPVSGASAAGSSAIASRYAGLNTFGDSICQGTGSTTFETQGPLATGYCWMLINDFGGVGQNYGTGGDQAADMEFKMMTDLAPAVDANYAVTTEIGVNDANIYGSKADSVVNFQQFDEGALAWAAIPDAAKVMANTANCIPAGAWSADGSRSYSATAGSTLTCTVTTYGPALYFVNRVKDGNAGSWSISIDGTVVDRGVNTGYGGATIHTANGQIFGFPLHRYTVAPGMHVVVLKDTMAGAAFEPVWLGSAGYLPASGVRPSTPPVVFAADIMLPRGSETIALNLLYTAAIKANVTQLAGDGLAVHFVPVQNFINNTTDYDGGTLANGYVCPVASYQPWHPNDCGHQHLREAFEASMGITSHSPMVTHPTTAISGTMTLNPNPRATAIFTPHFQQTDSKFSVTVVTGAALNTQTGIVSITFGKPWVVMQNGVDSGTLPVCTVTAGNPASTIAPIWVAETSDASITLTAGTVGLPSGTYVWNVSCGQ